MAKQDTITAAILRADALDWTVLRKPNSSAEAIENQSAPLDLGGNQQAEPQAGGAAIQKSMGGTVKGALTAILHTDQVLMRVVDLPSDDPDELQGMVELQVDKFSPFPIEHMAVTYEVLGVTDQSSRVLIAAAKRDVIQQLGDQWQAAGRLPDRIDVAAAGWWHVLQMQGALPGEGRHGLLLVDDTGCELVITQNGTPLVFRSLGMRDAVSDEEFFTEIAEETGYTLTSLESEWGAHVMPDLTVWHHGPCPDLLLEKLQAECDLIVNACALDELPPLTEGVARRTAVAGESPRLDLSLDDWKMAASSRKGQRRLVLAVSSLLFVWLLTMTALFTAYGLEVRRIDQLRAEIEALEGPADEARMLRRRVASLEQYADRTHSALEVLREVSVLMPSDLELTSFTYRKAGQVNVRGQSIRVPPILDFFEAMEQSPLFVSVNPEGITQAPGGRRNPDFRLTARLPGGDPE